MNKEEYSVNVKCTNFKELFENNGVPYYVRNVIPKRFLEKDGESLNDIPIYILEIESEYNDFRLHELDLYNKIIGHYTDADKLFALTPICGISNVETPDEAYLINNGFKMIFDPVEMMDLLEYLGLLYNSDTKTYVWDCPPMGIAGEWNGCVNHKFIDIENKHCLKNYHKRLYGENEKERTSESVVKSIFEERKFFAGDNYTVMELHPDISLSRIYASIPNEISFHMIINADYNHFCIIDFGKEFMAYLMSLGVKVTMGENVNPTVLEPIKKSIEEPVPDIKEFL